jgi:hypothetical protein
MGALALAASANAASGAQDSPANPGSARPPVSPAAALIDPLMERWTGVFDTAEQVVLGGPSQSDIASDTDDRRIRTIVAPVSVPWLGAHVLYLEEFLHEDPDNPRRLLLLRLEPDLSAAQPTVRVRQYTFREPSRWLRLYRDSARLQRLTKDDLESMPSCDLRMVREGDHFRGRTARRTCFVSTGEPGRYVDYQLLIGKGLYWYHKRILSFTDDELLEETIAFDWFELHEARLFTCRIRWKPEANAGPPLPLSTVDLHDQGGRAKFTTPDGKEFELELHSRDWPFDTNRDALILMVQASGATAPMASSWTGLQDSQIAVDLGWMAISCGPFAPQDGGTIT